MERRPYRQKAPTNPRMANVLSLIVAAALFTLVNSWVTYHTAYVLRASSARALGTRRYPFDWIRWAHISWNLPQLHPYWIWVLKVEAIALCALAVGIGFFQIIYQRRTRINLPDLHGSARWATLADVRRAHLLPSTRRGAITRGIIVGRWKSRILVDTGEGHVLVTAPTRGGKGTGVVVPTLLSWPKSTLIHDISGENWALTAGWRKSRGHIVLKFDPANPEGSIKYNPLSEIRIGTDHEYEDASAIAHALIYPGGDQFGDYWHDAAIPLLIACILHVLHEGKDPTLHGVQWLFSNPEMTREATIKLLLKSTHNLIASAMREFEGKAEKEASGVASQMMAVLELYRGPVIEKNTSCSEFRIDDLMNHDRPVDLYLIVHLKDQKRLRPLVRILIQQILYHYTGSLTFKDGRAIAKYKHPLLMMLDEFPTLGRFEALETMMATVAKYGIRCCVVTQSLGQIEAVYGHNQSIVSNCATQVEYTPNDIKTAKEIAARAGVTTVRREQRSQSSNGYSTQSEPETSRDLLQAFEAITLHPDAALINVHGLPTIYARKLRYQHVPNLKKRVMEPPAVSDVIHAATPNIPTPRRVVLKASKPAQQLPLIQDTLI